MYSTSSLSARSASPPPEPYTSSASLSTGSASASGDEVVVLQDQQQPPSSSGSSSSNLPAPVRKDRVRRAVSSGAGGAGQGGRAGLGGDEVRERRPSNTSAEDGKVDQIIQHFYSKTFAVIFQARATHPESTSAGASPSASSTIAGGRQSPALSSQGVMTAQTGLRRTSSAGGSGAPGARRTNRWFNLEIPDIPDSYRPSLRIFRSISLLPPTEPIPPLTLTIYLDTSTLSANQVLTLTSASTGKRIRVPTVPVSSQSNSTTSAGVGVGVGGGGNSKSPNVVLERWELQLRPSTSTTSTTSTSSPITTSSVSTELPTVYKSSILHFRTLYTLLRALPTYNLYRRLARARVGGAGLVVGVRIGESVRDGELGLEEGIWGEGELRTGAVVEKIELGGVGTPFGTLHLSSTYRLNTDFAIEAIETLLSSTFIDQDFFTRLPSSSSTFARQQQRPSINQIQSQSPSSLRGLEQDEKRPLSALSRGRPGSLPSTGAVQPPKSFSPPRAIPPPSHQQPRGSITDRPASYGSLSSRHPFPQTHATGSAGSGSGTNVEPAFVSLSRARGTSYTGVPGPSGILRAVPISSSPNSRTATPPISSSPIFRQSSSYLGSSSSSSPLHTASGPISTGPTSNIHRVSSSPLVPPSSSFRSSPTAMPSSPQPMSMRPHSTSFTGGGSYSRSYGRTSSQGSEASGHWGGAQNEPTKKFLNPAPEQEDAEDINAFLGMIDSKPNISSGGNGGASVILSKEMAEEQLKKLAGSGFLLSPGERDSGRLSAALLRSKGSRLSIEEEPPQGVEGDESGSGSGGTRAPRIKRSVPASSGMGLSSSPAGTTVPRYFLPTSSTTPIPTTSLATAIPTSSITSSPSSSPRFPPYIPQHHHHHRVRSQIVTTGFELPSSTTSASPSPSISQSGSNLVTRSGSGGRGVLGSLEGGDSSTASLSEGAGGERSYGGEEEAVGRLELGGEDDEVNELEMEGRGRGFEEDRSRDKTPGQSQGRAPSLGYRRWGTGASPPEISWMG